MCAPRSAAPGREALDLLGKQAFDLVILDIQMPQPDGYEMFSAMQAGLIHAPTGVLFMSAGAREREARQHGAKFFLAKPFGVDDLLNTVHTILR